MLKTQDTEAVSEISDNHVNARGTVRTNSRCQPLSFRSVTIDQPYLTLLSSLFGDKILANET